MTAASFTAFDLIAALTLAAMLTFTAVRAVRWYRGEQARIAAYRARLPERLERVPEDVAWAQHMATVRKHAKARSPLTLVPETHGAVYWPDGQETA